MVQTWDHRWRALNHNLESFLCMYTYLSIDFLIFNIRCEVKHVKKIKKIILGFL